MSQILDPNDDNGSDVNSETSYDTFVVEKGYQEALLNMSKNDSVVSVDDTAKRMKFKI